MFIKITKFSQNVQNLFGCRQGPAPLRAKTKADLGDFVMGVRLVFLALIFSTIGASASVNANACELLRRNPSIAQEMMTTITEKEGYELNPVVTGVTRADSLSENTRILGVMISKKAEFPFLMTLDHTCDSIDTEYLSDEKYEKYRESREFSQ